MSEEIKPVRKIDEITREYQRVCMQAGHLQYQINTLETDLRLHNETLRNLNLEAANSKKAEDEAKAQPATESKESQ